MLKWQKVETKRLNIELMENLRRFAKDFPEEFANFSNALANAGESFEIYPEPLQIDFYPFNEFELQATIRKKYGNDAKILSKDQLFQLYLLAVDSGNYDFGELIEDSSNLDGFDDSKYHCKSSDFIVKRLFGHATTIVDIGNRKLEAYGGDSICSGSIKDTALDSRDRYYMPPAKKSKGFVFPRSYKTYAIRYPKDIK